MSRFNLRYCVLFCEILALAVGSFAFATEKRSIRSWDCPSIATRGSRPHEKRHLSLSKPLQLSSNGEEDAKPKIKFSGIDLDRKDQKSFVDVVFSALTSDVTSIALGSVGILVLLLGRLILDTDDMSVEALGEATRVNLLAVFACGAILLNGVSKLDIQSAMAERVQLVGVRPPEPVLLSSSASDSERITWVLDSMLTASPASSVVLLKTTATDAPWQIQAFAGIVPEMLTEDGKDTTLPPDTPILDRLRREDTESYLPTLQALPGRFEFSFLPPNTQAVLLLPVVVNGGSSRAAVVLGANQARSFTPRDIAWCQVMANRLRESI